MGVPARLAKPYRGALLLTALLLVLATTVALRTTGHRPRTGPSVPAGAAYDLATPVPPMTAAGCAATPECVDAGTLGAVGDDPRDDHAALTNAVAKAAPARGIVYLPPGSYLISKPLYLPSGVTLAGAGAARTRLLLSWEHLPAFRFNYLVAPLSGTATEVTLRDVTVDGGRRRSQCADGGYTASCQVNHGGGVKAGSGWTVRQVRFTGMNYFKLWICGVEGVRVLDSRWDNQGDDVGSGGEDNLGGGCGASGVVIAGNAFHQSIVGNVIDLTRASDVRVSRNWSARNSVIFEGVTDSSITDSTVLRGDINVISNSRYADADRVGNYNPARVTVSRNTIDGGMWGVNVGYADRGGADNHPGGANTVTDNQILRTARLGIVVSACQPTAKTQPDSVQRNVITDPGMAAERSYNAGCATFDPVGIGLAAGRHDRVTGNRVVDTRATPVTMYAVSIGERGDDCPPSDTIVNDNTASGVTMGVVRYSRSIGAAVAAAIGAACE